MTDISVAEMVCLMEYFVSITDEDEIRRLLAELRKDYKPVDLKPPVEFIFERVCEIFEVDKEELLKSKKRRHAYIKMVFTRVAARLHGHSDYVSSRFRKRIAQCLGCSLINITKYLKNDTKMFIVNKSCEDDIAYISTVTYYNYLKVRENEQKQQP